MNIKSNDFQVKTGDVVKLKKWPTSVKAYYESKQDYQDFLGNHIRDLSAKQNLLYASNRYALLLIFQGMDAAGKDGAIQHVMTGINPQGCDVFSFKQPSAEELEHDYLWRTNAHLPERGHIGIFNRSYYEEVLVDRVHPELLQNEGLANAASEETFWDKRYESINNLETHLYQNGTRIIKFFLHLSKDEQRKRFLARIDNPEKNWKFSQADIEERKFWNLYRKAYEACLSATSTKEGPWYIIPADDKENARMIISQILLDTLDDLGLSYPEVDETHRTELLSIRKLLESENQTEE